jgi:hypothetical protein
MSEIWLDCSIPDCPNKICTWGSESLCHPHEKAIVGEEEMIRRYNATHERPWSDPSVPGKPNYMIRVFAEAQEREK